jgi:hypothetical protein
MMAETTVEVMSKEILNETVMEATIITIMAGGIGAVGLAGTFLFLFCLPACLLIPCRQTTP